MATYSPELAEHVSEVMEDEGLSAWDIERRSCGEVSHMTARAMAKGVVTNTDLLVAWAASAYKERTPRERQYLVERTLAVAGRPWVKYNPDREPAFVTRRVRLGARIRRALSLA